MFQPVRFLLGLVLVSQLFSACKKDDEQVKPPMVTPGDFVLTTQTNKAAVDSEFDLGELFSSDDFILMIGNGGEASIFNITLSCNNSAFELSAKNIELLSGSLPAFIAVDITHGIPLKGVGTVPTLPKGENKAMITLKGETLSGRDTVEITKEFIVKVDAKVMDAKILSADIAPILGTNWYYSKPALIVEPSKIVKLVNTGNVPMHAIIGYGKTELYQDRGLELPGAFYKINNEIDLQPGETKDISSLVAPISGKRMEADKKYDYDGRTTIALSTQKAVYNVNSFVLYSK